MTSHRQISSESSPPMRRSRLRDAKIPVPQSPGRTGPVTAIDALVAVLSKLQRPSGDRDKSDATDPLRWPGATTWRDHGASRPNVKMKSVCFAFRLLAGVRG